MNPRAYRGRCESAEAAAGRNAARGAAAAVGRRTAQNGEAERRRQASGGPAQAEPAVPQQARSGRAERQAEPEARIKPSAPQPARAPQRPPASAERRPAATPPAQPHRNGSRPMRLAVSVAICARITCSAAKRSTRCAACRSTCPRATTSRSWARPAPARARCSMCSAASIGRRRASYMLSDVDVSQDERRPAGRDSRDADRLHLSVVQFAASTDGRREHRGAAVLQPPHQRRRRSGGAASWPKWSGLASGSTTGRRSFPAASSSAWRSPAAW